MESSDTSQWKGLRMTAEMITNKEIERVQHHDGLWCLPEMTDTGACRQEFIDHIVANSTTSISGAHALVEHLFARDVSRQALEVDEYLQLGKRIQTSSSMMCVYEPSFSFSNSVESLQLLGLRF
eukprot:TRINITY_DN14320_c0_g1_i1.p2 TRINITY_DN14320_c0_g1~~TRINITY_DN14320_c0_g1_i1.p2  ORF type:complete len:124 (+),score=13.53 TRINITY_DN14320_c0_g1_i1:800-1171(+)